MSLNFEEKLKRATNFISLWFVGYYLRKIIQFFLIDQNMTIFQVAPSTAI